MKKTSSKFVLNVIIAAASFPGILISAFIGASIRGSRGNRDCCGIVFGRVPI